MACRCRTSGFGASALPVAGLPCIAALVCGVALRAAAADPAKVLRIAFPTAETGFDPVRVSDLYSNTVNEAIFERLLTYDYLARPAKLVPMAAEAMPEVADNGRTYMFRMRKGIYFTPDPAFKGAEARARRARTSSTRSSASSTRRTARRGRSCSKARSRASTSWPRRRRSPASSTTTRRSPACEALDRYTLRVPARRRPTTTSPTSLAHVPFGAIAREVVEAYGDDIAGASGRHRALPAEGVEARGARSCSRPTPTTAASPGTSQPSRARVGRRARRGDEGQEDAADRPRRDQRSSRRTSRAGSRSTRRSSTSSTLPATFRPQVVRRRRQAEAGVDRRRACRCSRRSTPSITYTFFNFRDPVVGGFAQGEDRAAPRDHHGLQPRRGDPASSARARRCRRTCRSRRASSATTRRTGRINQYDPELANKLLDRFGYKKRRGRLPHAARRQAAGAPATRRGTVADRARVQRAVEEVDGRDRHPHASSTSASSPTT